MAELTLQRIAPWGIGVSPTYVACSPGGDTFFNDGGELVHLKNASGGAISVTVHYNATIRALHDAWVAAWNAAHPDYPYPLARSPYEGVQRSADVVVSVPAGGERLVGPFRPMDFCDPGGTPARAGYGTTARLTYSSASGLTVAVLRANLAILEHPTSWA